MESVADIQDMRVSQLKEFLKRNDVNASSISRSDGKDGPPRKSDLLAAALNVRADYENPQVNGPTSPKKKRNIFQSGYSPASSRNVTPGPKTRSPTRRRESSSGAMPSNAGKTPGSAKKPKPRRRSSVGWVNPNFLPQLTPKSSSARPAEPKPVETVEPDNKVSEPEEDTETYDNEFGDEGDQIVISDYDSTGAASGPESDGGSVIETDDDEEKSVNLFKLMKAYEVRAWLTEKGVQFNVRSKKAELISIATAHALYLENLASDAKPKIDRNPDPVPEPKVIYVDETEKPKTPAVPQRASGPRLYSRNVSAEERPALVPETRASDTRNVTSDANAQRPREDAATGKPDAVVPQETEVTISHSKNSRTASKRRIKAPHPDEDAGVDDEIVPASKPRRHKKRQGRPPGNSARRAEPRFTMPKISMPKISMPKISMPKITITLKGVTFFLSCLISAMISAIVFKAWSDAQRPFCEPGIINDRTCIPCPEHAHFCLGHSFGCIDHYKKSGKKCVEDSAVNDYAVHLEARIRKVLAVLQGRKQCGMVKDATMSKEELRTYFDPSHEANRKGRFDFGKFDSAFEKALQRLRDDSDIVHTASSIYGTDAFESDVAILYTSCRIKKFLWKHFKYVLLTAVLFFVGMRWYILRFFRERERQNVEQVYQNALEILRSVRIDYNDEDKGDAFMRDTELREYLLGRTTDESVKLWAKVEKLLQSDTRVLRSGPRSIKGMPCYVYEWRGNLRRPSLGSAGRDGVRSYTGLDSESRRRLSFGSASRRQSEGYDASSPPARRLSGSPPPVAPSPGYSQLLNFWNS